MGLVKGTTLHREAVVQFLITTRSGRTERELTRAIYGEELLYSKINQVCKELRAKNLIRRDGSGTSNDPYRYWPA